MAGPGQFSYFLTGQDTFFINSDDNKIKLTGQSVSIDVVDNGIVRPPAGSLTTSGNVPLPIGLVIPATVSVTLAGKQVNNPSVSPALGTLALSGKVPTLAHAVLPPSKSLVLTEYNAARWAGLWVEGYAPFAAGATVVAPAVGSLALSGKVPDRAVDDPAAQVRIPQTKPVTLSGVAPVGAVSHVALPTTLALTAQGRLTKIDDVVFPERGRVRAIGSTPIADRPGGEVVVVIEGPFNYGTFIRNRNATEDSKNRYTIDERTGFKVKVRKGYPLVEDYTGIHTRPESADAPEFQDRVRQTKTRYKQGAIRPEPVGNEIFIDPNNPVDPDDL